MSLLKTLNIKPAGPFINDKSTGAYLELVLHDGLVFFMTNPLWKSANRKQPAQQR